MSDPSYRDGLRERTRRIAYEILNSSGITGLQARKVASAAGCSVGTLYNLYPNLDELIVVANTETLRELGQALVGARDGTDPALSIEARLLVVADAYLDFAVLRQNGWRAVFEHRLEKNRVLTPSCRAAQSELFAIVETILDRVITEEQARRRAARAIFGAVHGIISLALDEKLGPFDKSECSKQVRLVVSAAARQFDSV